MNTTVGYRPVVCHYILCWHIFLGCGNSLAIIVVSRNPHSIATKIKSLQQKLIPDQQIGISRICEGFLTGMNTTVACVPVVRYFVLYRHIFSGLRDRLAIVGVSRNPYVLYM